MRWPRGEERYALALCLLVCLGFTLSLRLLDRFPLREDEAIYSVWALHFWRQDPLFLTVWPDKPPLFLWTLALIFEWWGASPAAGRLLNIMLTLLTALVIGATARRLWGKPSALLATALYLLNPFAMSFAPTIYTDPMLVFAGQVALWLALTGRSLGAGIWLAVAIMTKQQGLFYAPLIGLALWHGQPSNVRRWYWFGLGALLVLAPILYWDSLRWAVAPSPWDLGVRNYGALQLVAPVEWLARSRAWGALLWYFTASWTCWWLVGVIFLGAVGYRLRALWPLALCSLQRLGQSPILWLTAWGVGFLLLHSVTSIQRWDRYLLPLVPIFCLLVTWAIHQWCRALSAAWAAVSPRRLWLGALLGLLWLLPPALTASAGGWPIGGDHGAYGGLAAALAWLQQQPVQHAILYEQKLGWQAEFYLYDQLASGAYERRWFPTALYLADNAAKTPYRTRWLIQPDWDPQPALALQLAVRQLQLVPQARFDGITIYTVENQAQAPCNWCLCQPPVAWPTITSPALDLERGQP